MGKRHDDSTDFDEEAHDRFWVFGADEYEKALTEQHDRAVADLLAQIDAAATDVEKKILIEKLDQVEAEYRRKLANIGASLF